MGTSPASGPARPRAAGSAPSLYAASGRSSADVALATPRSSLSDVFSRPRFAPLPARPRAVGSAPSPYAAPGRTLADSAPASPRSSLSRALARARAFARLPSLAYEPPLAERRSLARRAGWRVGPRRVSGPVRARLRYGCVRASRATRVRLPPLLALIEASPRLLAAPSTRPKYSMITRSIRPRRRPGSRSGAPHWLGRACPPAAARAKED